MLAEPKLESRPFEVMKFPVLVERRVLVLSPLVGINTHYFDRSVICGGRSCPACKRGIAFKYAGYVVVWHEGVNRLMRLTATAAVIGGEGGLFVPGRVIRVVKPKERRPLTLMGDGDARQFDVSTIISRIELLSVVARLHGLPGLPDGIPEKAALELVERNAATAVALALGEAA